MKKKKIPFKMTGFSILVLVLLAFLLFFKKDGQADPLFDKNNAITLYVETQTGQIPEIDFKKYFPDGNYDYAKFTYDKEICDWNTAGTYLTPVSYDGEKTACTIKITVRSEVISPSDLPQTEIINP